MELLRNSDAIKYLVMIIIFILADVEVNHFLTESIHFIGKLIGKVEEWVNNILIVCLST